MSIYIRNPTIIKVAQEDPLLRHMRLLYKPELTKTEQVTMELCNTQDNIPVTAVDTYYQVDELGNLQFDVFRQAVLGLLKNAEVNLLLENTYEKDNN